MKKKPTPNEEEKLSLLEQALSAGEDSVPATQRLVELYEPFVLHLESVYQGDSLFPEDLHQEGILCLLKALHSYRRGLGVPLDTHMLNNIRWGVQKYVRRELRVSRGPGRSPMVSIDHRAVGAPAGGGEGVGPTGSLWNYAIDESGQRGFEIREMANLVREALKCLTPQQRKVIDRVFFDRIRPSDVAKELGISRARVSQILRESYSRLGMFLEPGKQNSSVH